MLQTLWLIPTIPLVSFLLLATLGKRLGRAVATILGVGSVGLSAILSIIMAVAFFGLPQGQTAFTQSLWTWFDVGNLSPDIGFQLDSLSLLMMLVVTIVGFLIHLYSSKFMAEDDGFSRFFAYMNLFVSFMLVLVLADNLLFLLVGWEGVGLCSYLLIGFWYSDPANGSAARKAFVVTRVGDTAMLIALFLLFWQFDTLNIQEILYRATSSWQIGSGMAVAVAALLLGGAVGKSAQLPLQTWLPDAMAGPTPVSALIHAATRVTAGVYLIARTNGLFDLAPVIQTIVAIVGALTLILAGFAALTQHDIKRVLAYSTISQIGYMFLALGVGAYSAAMFHFMTHAFFKALLFLGAGVLIHVLHHEHDMFKMGGLRKLLPTTYWTFLVGSMSLAAIPLISSGFYSKDQILWLAWSSTKGSPLLWLAGLIGALLTALYTFRMVFVTFFGEAKMMPEHRPSRAMTIPLIILAVFSTIGGFVELPDTMGHVTLFSDFLHTTLPAVSISSPDSGAELLFQIIAAVAALGGVFIAHRLYHSRSDITEQLMSSPSIQALYRFWKSGFGFDSLYHQLFVRPYYWIARINRHDVIDLIYVVIAWITQGFSSSLSRTQTGKIRNYAFGIALGAVVMIGLVIFL